jgi:hypothetical protein
MQYDRREPPFPYPNQVIVLRLNTPHTSRCLMLIWLHVGDRGVKCIPPFHPLPSIPFSIDVVQVLYSSNLRRAMMICWLRRSHHSRGCKAIHNDLPGAEDETRWGGGSSSRLRILVDWQGLRLNPVRFSTIRPNPESDQWRSLLGLESSGVSGGRTRQVPGLAVADTGPYRTRGTD